MHSEQLQFAHTSRNTLLEGEWEQCKLEFCISMYIPAACYSLANMQTTCIEILLSTCGRHQIKKSDVVQKGA